MLILDDKIFKIRDKSVSEISSRMITEIEMHVNGDSFMDYILSSNIVNELSKVILKNNNSYEISYRSNYNRLNILKNSVNWVPEEPLTDFENELFDLIREAESFIEVDDYSINDRSKEIISKSNKLFQEYCVKSKLIDKELRSEFFIRLNRIRAYLSKDDLISTYKCHTAIDELDILCQNNEKLFYDVYSSLKNRTEEVRSEFNKMRNYFDYNTIKLIELKLDKITDILESQSYEIIRKAEGIVNEIEYELNASAEIKLKRTIEIVRSELDSLKTSIWLDDWLKIREELEIMISEAESTGLVKDLNLDKFKTSRLILQKKQDVFDFIDKLESAKNCDKSLIAGEARRMLRTESSKVDLDGLNKLMLPCAKKEQEERSPVTMTKKKIFYLFVFLLTLTSVILFLINQKLTRQYYNTKGQKYADIVETMAYSEFKAGKTPDKSLIRKKLLVPKEDFEIIAITERLVTVMYKGEIYKKSIRSRK